MSDALTNSEIEDVLTSVRRLVADDVRRTAGEGSTDARAVGAQGGRLILTQAQRIDAVDDTKARKNAAESDRPKAVAPVSAEPMPVRARLQTPLPETPVADPSLTQAPDFRRLEATIAELEAAVSASGSVFEPDGTENAPASNVTALYAKPSFLHTAPAEAISPRPDAALRLPPAPPGIATTDNTDADDADDDDVFETVIDEATLRILVAQIVREELQGQLGERVTLQVRKLVRSEIAKALDSRDLI